MWESEGSGPPKTAKLAREEGLGVLATAKARGRMGWTSSQLPGAPRLSEPLISVSKDSIRGVIAQVLERNTTNLERIRKSPQANFFGLHQSAVSDVFETCSRLGLAWETRHSALAIWEVAMSSEIKCLPTDNAKRETAILYLRNRVQLIVLISIQIASKYSSLHHSLNVKEMRELMEERMRVVVSKDEVLSMELTILCHLGGRLNQGLPNQILELLLCLCRDGKWIPAKELDTHWETGMELLDLVALQKEPIYRFLLSTALTQPAAEVSLSDLVFVGADAVLLASGVFCAAAYFLSPPNTNRANTIAADLEHILHHEKDEILALVSAIVHQILVIRQHSILSARLRKQLPARFKLPTNPAPKRRLQPQPPTHKQAGQPPPLDVQAPGTSSHLFHTPSQVTRRSQNSQPHPPSKPTVQKGPVDSLWNSVVAIFSPRQ